MRQPSIPILMYHQISPTPSSTFARYTVTPTNFAWQMGYLRWAGYTTITLDALLAGRAGLRRLPRQPVVITFDDGFQEAVEHAVPILQTQGFTAIFFLVAGLVGQHSLWLDHELGCTFPLLEWSTARQLERDGFPCGAHSWRHPRLTDVAADECLGELIDSRKLLEDELGHPVRHLAYPYGAYSATVRTSAITAGYRTACSTRRGASPPTDDPWALPRVSIYGSDNRLDFVCRLHTARSGRELLRQALQRATQHPMPRSKELPQSSC